MEALTHHEVTLMMLSLAILLAVARALGEIAQWLHQPSVVGELLAGVLLGPTVLGAIAPSWHTAIFPAEGHVAVVFSGMTTLAITLFLLVAGMEVDLSSAWRQGAVAFKVGLLGMVIPFAIGFGAAWQIPNYMGSPPGADRLIFALFFATALSISALPVIAKTLMDLDLYRSDLGMIIVSAAVFNDLVGWIIFALILGMMGSTGGHGTEIWVTIFLTLLFTGGMLTVGRAVIHRILPYVQAYTHWPGGILSFAFSLALLGAALTEWIGVHAIFGAFLIGVAIGDSNHLREQTRSTIDHFVSFIFAPLFFGSIGLHVNFADHFDAPLVFTVLAIACVGKLIGCWLGGYWGGMSHRTSLAVGFGMNARGAMEIILGLLALQAGVIRIRLFVALVVMAIVTSIMSGPLMQILLRRKKPKQIASYLTSQRFVPRLTGQSRNAVIEELSLAACTGTMLDPQLTAEAVLAREETMATSIGQGVALPHARLASLTQPVVAMGISDAGIDFDAPDGLPVQIVFLILTPLTDDRAQLDLMASIAHAFHNPKTVERMLRSQNITEILAILKSQGKQSSYSPTTATPPRPQPTEVQAPL